MNVSKIWRGEKDRWKPVKKEKCTVEPEGKSKASDKDHKQNKWHLNWVLGDFFLYTQTKCLNVSQEFIHSF